MSSFTHDRDEYQALSQTAGVFRMPNRTLLQITGNDRIPFLHNMCSNDLLKRSVGQGVEAFTLTAQGKIIGHFFLFVEQDRVILDSAPGNAPTLISHFDRYLIREDVRIVDRSQELVQCLVVGPESSGVVEDSLHVSLEQQLDHAETRLEKRPLVVRRVDWCGPECLSVVSHAADMEVVVNRLQAAGARACDEQWLEVLRIEQKTPWYGVDIHEDNLPQEVDRNSRAIDFDKGCYLGQETVARIDAMGHVNRLLVGLRFTSAEPPASRTELEYEGKVVGSVLSSSFSPYCDAPIGLAYVRREAWEVGTQLNMQTDSRATVISLPVDRAATRQDASS